jgi:chlorite dismutase
MHVDLLGTELGRWLDTPYLYTATTKDSQYMKPVAEAGFRKPKPLDIVPVDRKYIIVYPFVKQRRWYALSAEERGAAMREHAMIGRNYPGIKLNTAYSFGIDDQEFMTAFETDSVQDFLDLMMELRHSEASQYTERDTPIFTCLFASPREVLDALDGSRAAVALPV